VSFDVVILQPREISELLASLEEVGNAFPLGTPDEIRRQMDLAIPHIEWSSGTSGAYKAKEGYVLEISIPDEKRPSSLHLALHSARAGKAAAVPHSTDWCARCTKCTAGSRSPSQTTRLSCSSIRRSEREVSDYAV
jgi:hypothetical protein